VFADVVWDANDNTRVRCLLCHAPLESIARSSLPGHLVSNDHGRSLASREIEAQAAEQRQDELAAAYDFQPWSATVMDGYTSPGPAYRPNMAEEPSHDIDMSDMFYNLCERTSTVFPPVFDPEQEQINLEDQSRMMAQMAQEQDEFGDSFFNERDETQELRESLQAMGT
jgi:hypothetical protein